MRVCLPPFFAKNIPPDAVFNADTETERYINRLAEICIRFCNARALLTKHDLPKDEDEDEQNPLQLLSELESIDSDFEAWARSPIDSLRYTVMSVERPTETVFSNYYHVYNSMLCSTAWNNYRTIRMRLNAMLKIRLRRISRTLATDTDVDTHYTYHKRTLEPI
jgi:hypothetical protein